MMAEASVPRTLLWSLYEHVAMAMGLLVLVLFCLIWLPFALALQFVLPRQLGRRVGRWMIAFGFRLYLNFLQAVCSSRFDLSELDALREQGPLILVANHPSLIDAVLVVSRLPNAVCVMKADLMNNLLLGSAARLAGYIRNDGPVEMVVHATETLQQGAHLLLFPEGTRTTHFPLDACSSSTALISRRSGIPVQTLLIDFSTPYLGKDWPIWRKPRLPLSFSVRLGKRFEPAEDAAAFTRELEAYLREACGHCGHLS